MRIRRCLRGSGASVAAVITPYAAAVAHVARAALGDQQAEIGSWERKPLAWQAIAPTTAELARYSGVTADGRPWSAVRKVLQRAGARWTDDWRREIDVYASGFLESLPAGITAPRVYAIEETEEQASLWLEDVSESIPVWPLARYGVAARDLGRFNGAYLAGRPRRALPRGVTGSREGRAAANIFVKVLDDPGQDTHSATRIPALTLDGYARLHPASPPSPHLARTAAVSHLDACARISSPRQRSATETVATLVAPGARTAGQRSPLRDRTAHLVVTWRQTRTPSASSVRVVTSTAARFGLAGAGPTSLALRRAQRFGPAAPRAWLRWFTRPERREWLERNSACPSRSRRSCGAFSDSSLTSPMKRFQTRGSNANVASCLAMPSEPACSLLALSARRAPGSRGI